MIRRRHILCVHAAAAILAIGGPLAIAEPVLTDNPTLIEYLAVAAANNAGLRAASNEWRAAREQVRQAGTLPDPSLAYTYFVEEVETRAGPQEQRLGVSQMFPWFGKLGLREDMADRGAAAAFERYQAVELQVVYTVKRAYYEYFYLSRAIAVTDENIQLLKRLEGVARSKHRAGAPLSGVIKAQIELGKLDDRLRSLRAMRPPIVAGLNAALNRPLAAALPWPTDVAFTAASISDADVMARLVAHNPELRALGQHVAKRRVAVELARKDYFPDFMLGVDYTDTGESMSGGPDSGKDAVMARIAIDLPIWRGKYAAGVDEAMRRRDAASLVRTQRENQLQADVQMALYRFRDAERKIDLYGDALIPQADEALQVTEEAYRAGAADFLDVIDAERLRLEFQLAKERALADREIALAEIEKLVGRPVHGQPNK